MGRPAYRITDADYNNAMIYLLEQHKYSLAYHQLALCQTGEELQVWCDEQLSADEFKRLKQVILARRKRTRDMAGRKKPKQITLQLRAWRSLKQLAKEDGLTYSEVLEKYMEALCEMPKPVREQWIATGKLTRERGK